MGVILTGMILQVDPKKDGRLGNWKFMSSTEMGVFFCLGGGSMLLLGGCNHHKSSMKTSQIIRERSEIIPCFQSNSSHVFKSS